MNTMKRAATAAGLSLVATAALGTAPTAAAPSNNTESFPITCTGPDGPFEGDAVASVKSNSAVVFFEGRPLVAKAISGDFTGTLIAGNETRSFTESFTESAGKGVDPARLATCAFENSFTETFTLTKRDIAELELDPALLGTEATFSGTVSSGMASVLDPTR